MPHYILSGRKGLFPSVTVLRRADSASAALAAFAAEGYADIVLHTDEAMAATIDPQVFQNGTTPHQFLQYATTPNTYSARFRRYLLHAAPWWPLQIVGVVLLFIMVKSAIQLGNPFDQLRVFWWLIPIIIASIATLLSRPAHWYGQLMDALAWHRPDEALNLIKKLRSSAAVTTLPTYELTFRESQALAMLGKIDEALDLVESMRDEAPEWLFWNAVSEVYTYSGRNPERLAAMERCVEAAPNNATADLDLAMTLVRINGDMTRARKMLNRARSQPVAEMVRPFVKVAEGMILVQEGDGAAAVPLLEDAIQSIVPLANSNGLAAALRDRTQAYLALAYGQAGDHERAVAAYRQAERRLNLVPTFWDLRDRCLKELRCTPHDDFAS